MGRQKSAEAIVVHCIAGATWLTGGRRAELVEAFDTERSMCTKTTDPKAAMPEPVQKAGGGTAEDMNSECSCARHAESMPNNRPLAGIFDRNRRIRNRTSGDVGGRGRQRPLLPDPTPKKSDLKPVLVII